MRGDIAVIVRIIRMYAVVVRACAANGGLLRDVADRAEVPHVVHLPSRLAVDNEDEMTAVLLRITQNLLIVLTQYLVLFCSFAPFSLPPLMALDKLCQVARFLRHPHEFVLQQLSSRRALQGHRKPEYEVADSRLNLLT